MSNCHIVLLLSNVVNNILTEIPLKHKYKQSTYVKSYNDYNQTIVANAIHVAQTTYSDYEKGKVRIPLECLIALAKFYNVDMNYISGVSDIKNPFPED